ncbi:hypothetical protein FH972_023719 [Carpinus fangiana]|uniref:ADF-H domain-containing protein n=1 Tax=Carpinus fangiana TaxID=176857 RepID=A0A5N6KW07_9ROSI|nr:hypothetical protein FH972_023719 [Carpinus fangiana]
MNGNVLTIPTRAIHRRVPRIEGGSCGRHDTVCGVHHQRGHAARTLLQPDPHGLLLRPCTCCILDPSRRALHTHPGPSPSPSPAAPCPSAVNCCIFHQQRLRSQLANVTCSLARALTLCRGRPAPSLPPRHSRYFTTACRYPLQSLPKPSLGAVRLSPAARLRRESTPRTPHSLSTKSFLCTRATAKVTPPTQKKGHRRLPSTPSTPHTSRAADSTTPEAHQDTDVKRTLYTPPSGSGAAIAMRSPNVSPHSRQANPSPPSHPRPGIMSYPSNSAPSTPQQLPRDSMRNLRTPSPNSRRRKTSPRSVSSESSRVLPSMRTVSDGCRFQSTQTSRRRMPYNIGSEPLEAEKPFWTMSSDRREQITLQCETLYQKLLPSADSQRRRDALVAKLQRILEEEMPESRIKIDVFGSSGNLLCTSDSDVDVCVTMSGNGMVCSIASILAKRAMDKVTCVHAKSVPIVKIWDPELAMACDLNVNNQVALINTRLVRAYMQIGHSARKLAMLVKHWTQQRVINEASGGTLSSYSWTLLVINFLQVNNILPVITLQGTDGKAKENFSADVEAFKNFGPSSPPPLGDLFYDFFKHYGFDVDFETSVFSVRSGVISSKADSRWSRIANNNRLCVEEPFNNDRNLGNTADDTAMRGLHLEMRNAARSMGNGSVNIEGGVCQLFEFSLSEPKYPIFERPPPQPRPVLTRSRSQAGRGGRGSVNMRGGSRAYDQRNAANSRRASSATAYAGQGPIGLMPPEMWQHMDPYTIQQDLHNLTRHLSHEQERLRLVQQQIMEQRMQQSNLGGSGNRRSYAGPSLPSQPGSPGPQTPSFENGPRTAPLFPSYGNGFRYDTSVPMSQSSSHQGSNSKQSSPMLSEAVPLRRSAQQQIQAPDSPGASQRSRSQPARPGQPGQPMGYPYMQYVAAGHQLIYGNSQQQYPYLVPRYYTDQRGIRYLYMPNAVPREYVGYGINSNSPHAPAGMELSSIPAYEDLQRQGRPRSPVPRDGHAVFSESPARSPSALSSNVDDYHGLQSAPLPVGYVNDRQSVHVSHHDTQGPVIVNGSGLRNSLPAYDVLPPPHTASNENGVAPHIPAAHRNSDGGQRSFADRAAAISRMWPDQQNLTYVDQSDTASSYDDSGSYIGGDTLASSQDLPPVPSLSRPPPGRHVEGSTSGHAAVEHASGDATLSPARLPVDPQPNGQRRSSGNSRPSIPSLDLGVPGRVRDGAPSSTKVLSPVQERRTPSPTSSRRAEPKRNSLPNGKPLPNPIFSPKGKNFSELPTPPTPLPAAGAAGPSTGPAGQPLPTPPLKATPSSRAGGQASTNQWQQAGGRKKKGYGGAVWGVHLLTPGAQKIDIASETLVLAATAAACTPASLAGEIDASSPRYSIYSHADPSTQGSQLLFLYTCPSSSSIKERMLYAASRAITLNVTLPDLGLQISKRLEASSPDEITEDVVLEELGVKAQSLSSLILNGRGAVQITRMAIAAATCLIRLCFAVKADLAKISNPNAEEKAFLLQVLNSPWSPSGLCVPSRGGSLEAGSSFLSAAAASCPRRVSPRNMTASRISSPTGTIQDTRLVAFKSSFTSVILRARVAGTRRAVPAEVEAAVEVDAVTERQRCGLSVLAPQSVAVPRVEISIGVERWNKDPVKMFKHLGHCRRLSIVPDERVGNVVYCADTDPFSRVQTCRDENRLAGAKRPGGIGWVNTQVECWNVATLERLANGGKTDMRWEQ